MRFIKIVLIITSIILAGLGIRYFITWDIWDAIKKNRVNFVSNYLSKGGDANATRNHPWLEGRPEQNFTLLMDAAEKGKPDIVSILLQNGADSNAETHIGRTALIFAAKNGNIKSIDLLIKHGANIKHSYAATENGSKQDALSRAIIYWHADAVELLINHGAQVTQDHLKLAEIWKKNYKNQEPMIKLLQKHLQTH